MKKDFYKKAFTVVEMLVVIAIMSIMLTYILINIKKSRLQARDKVRVADIQKIRLALEEYKLHCGEYPNKLELTAHNGCHHQEHLSDFLPVIPVAPAYTTGDLSGPDGRYYQSQISDANTYFYAGLSTSPTGKCYNYHIGAELEQNEINEGSRSRYLNQDHDASPNSGIYHANCPGSHSDFGDNDIEKDDNMGLYDFRATSQ